MRIKNGSLVGIMKKADRAFVLSKFAQGGFEDAAQNYIPSPKEDYQ